MTILSQRDTIAYMILSFKCRETKKVWNQIKSKKWPLAVQRIGLRKLFMLNRAGELNDLRIPPANRLEKLKGKRAGEFVFNGITAMLLTLRLWTITNFAQTF